MQIGPDVTKVIMSGELTVRRAAEIQSNLLSAILEQRAIELDCMNASDVDLTFVQLVLAARRSADDSGVRLSVAHPEGGVLHAALLRSGLLGSSAQSAEADRRFWSCSAKEEADGQDDPHRR